MIAVCHPAKTNAVRLLDRMQVASVMFVASPNHPGAGKTLTPEALNRETLIFTGKGCPYRSFLDTLLYTTGRAQSHHGDPQHPNDQTVHRDRAGTGVP